MLGGAMLGGCVVGGGFVGSCVVVGGEFVVEEGVLLSDPPQAVSHITAVTTSTARAGWVMAHLQNVFHTEFARPGL